MSHESLMSLEPHASTARETTVRSTRAWFNLTTGFLLGVPQQPLVKLGVRVILIVSMVSDPGDECCQLGIDATLPTSPMILQQSSITPCLALSSCGDCCLRGLASEDSHSLVFQLSA